MPFEDLPELIISGIELLGELSRLDNPRIDSIKLSIEQANGESFSLVLYNCDKGVRWERKGSYKQRDNLRITNIFERLKRLVKKIIPGIIKQKGTTKLREAKQIFTASKPLMELNNNEENESTFNDGTTHLLQINMAGKQKAFRWKAIPSAWNEVEQIFNRMIKLNNKIY